jgi:hypothetical protein
VVKTNRYPGERTYVKTFASLGAIDLVRRTLADAAPRPTPRRHVGAGRTPPRRVSDADRRLADRRRLRLGSIPSPGSSVRRWAHLDVRRIGSGNVGATNALRATTPAIGLLVALADAARARSPSGWRGGRTPATARVALAAVASVVGHVAPMWLRFRGGKGVATASGAFAVLAPVARRGVRRVRRGRLDDAARLARLAGGDVALVGTAAWHEPLFVKEAAAAVAADDRAEAPRQHHAAAAGHRAPARDLSRHASTHRRSRRRQLGTALAVHLARSVTTCGLWGRDAALVDRLARRASKPTTCRASRSTASADRVDRGGGRGATLVVVAVPSQGLRAVVHRAVAMRAAAVPFVSAAKGLEHGTLYRMSQVIAGRVRPGARGRGAVRARPFAAEVAAGLPTAVVGRVELADAALPRPARVPGPVAAAVCDRRRRRCRDRRGASRTSWRLPPASSRASASGTTRWPRSSPAGLVEDLAPRRPRWAAGPDTLAGLSGLGDLVLTCTGQRSRNRRSASSSAAAVARRHPARQRMVAEGCARPRRRSTSAPATASSCRSRPRCRPSSTASGPEGGTRELMLRPQKSDAEARPAGPDPADMIAAWVCSLA